MSSSVSAPAKILLIDANVFMARRITDALKLEGFEVVHSTQSGFALTMLEYDTPSAILCSTNLREISAHDLPPIIHADWAWTAVRTSLPSIASMVTVGSVSCTAVVRTA